ncbi:MAG TPA: hypothetical protein VN947_33300 [Polyangia bacterium]|nr:hypothetical protein [Polyangia bacterium]
MLKDSSRVVDSLVAATPSLLNALRLVQGVAFIAVVQRIALRQREQHLDLTRRRAVPQPSSTLR